MRTNVCINQPWSTEFSATIFPNTMLRWSTKGRTMTVHIFVHCGIATNTPLNCKFKWQFLTSAYQHILHFQSSWPVFFPFTVARFELLYPWYYRIPYLKVPPFVHKLLAVKWSWGPRWMVHVTDILSRFHSVVKRMSSPKELVAMNRFHCHWVLILLCLNFSGDTFAMWFENEDQSLYFSSGHVISRSVTDQT